MRIFVGSPFRGETIEIRERNIAYAKDCCKTIAKLGHYPFAPHLHDTQFLDDNIEEERNYGLESGRSFMLACDAAVFFTDRGISDGMRGDIEQALKHNIATTYASLDLLPALEEWLRA